MRTIRRSSRGAYLGASRGEQQRRLAGTVTGRGRGSLNVDDDVHRALGLTDDEADRIIDRSSAASRTTSSWPCTRSCGPSTAPTSRLASTSAAADRGAMGAGRPGRERRRGRRGRRDRRGHPHREPQPPVRHRALPGRGHGGGRHPPRHLHHGRPAHRADGPAPLRPARRRPQPLDRRGRRQRHLGLRQRGRACRPSAARSCSTRPTRATRWSTCCASGVLPVDRLVLGQATGVGNLAVLLGSTTGPRRHRRRVSVLASAGFGDAEADAAKRPSVQVGDPFEEKRLIEACLALLDAGLVVGIQDLGGAGLTCATSETAVAGGVGMDVDVTAVPRREPGMEPFEVMTSGEPGAHARHRRARPTSTRCWRICARWEVRATVVGRVTDGRRRCASSTGDGEVLADVPASSLHEDAPALRPAPACPATVGRARPGHARPPPARRAAPTCSACSPTPAGCGPSTTTSCS